MVLMSGTQKQNKGEIFSLFLFEKIFKKYMKNSWQHISSLIKCKCNIKWQKVTKGEKNEKKNYWTFIKDWG